MDMISSHDSLAARADLDFWGDLAAGDDAFARELLTMYLGDTSRHISQIISSAAGGRTDEVARAAHTCAGSSGTCGVDTLAGLFRRLELQARDNHLDEVSTIVPLIVETFDQVQTRLTRAIAA